MPHAWVIPKYAGVLESLVTVEPQLRNDVLFSLSQVKRVRNELRSLPDRRLVRDNAVVAEIPDHGQIKDCSAGLDVRDICYPFLIGTFCPELPVQEIGITAQALHGLVVRPSASNPREQVIIPHNTQDRLFIQADSPLLFQPNPDSPVSVSSMAGLMALTDHIRDARVLPGPVQILYIAVITAAGDAEESAHNLNGILFPVLMDNSKLHAWPHFFPSF